MALARPWVMFRLRLKNRVRVHTTAGDTLEGVAIRDRAGWLVLADCSRVGGEGPVKLSGEVWVPRERIRFAQAVG